MAAKQVGMDGSWVIAGGGCSPFNLPELQGIQPDVYFIGQFDTGHKIKPGTSESTGSKEVPSLVVFGDLPTDQAVKEVSTAEDELKKAMQARPN